MKTNRLYLIFIFTVCIFLIVGCRKRTNEERIFKPFTGEWKIKELVFTDYGNTVGDSVKIYSIHNAGEFQIKPSPDMKSYNPVFFTDTLENYITWFMDMAGGVSNSSIPGKKYCYAYSDFERLRLYFWGSSGSGSVVSVVNVEELTKNKLILYYPNIRTDGNLSSTCRVILEK